MSTPSPSTTTAPGMRRWQRWAIGIVAVLALLCLVLWLAVPRAARWGVETVAARELGRTTSLADAQFNPFTLTARLHGLQIDGRTGEPPLLRIENATIGVSPMTIARLAPVIKALRIDGLELNLARLGEAQFNFSDIVDRLRAKPKPKDDHGKPAQFAVYNIQLARGLIRLDDRVVGRKHELTEIALGVPFISALPLHTEVEVEPGFSARLNGTPVKLDAATKPFAESRETAVELKLDGLDVPTFLGYSPVKVDFTLPSGKLDTDLRIAFHAATPAKGTQPAQAAQVVVSGTVALRELALHAPAAQPQPLLRWQRLDVDIEAIAPLARRVDLRSVKLTGPEAWVARDAQGSLNWLRFAQRPVSGTPKEAAPSVAPAPSARPLDLSVRRVELVNGLVHVRDDALGGFTTDLTDLGVVVEGLSTTAAEPAKLRASARAAQLEGLAADGTLRLQPLSGQVGFEVKSFDLRAANRIVDTFLNGTLTGVVSTQGKVEFAQGAEGLAVTLGDLGVSATRIALRGPAGSGASLDVAELRLEGGKVDLAKRSVALDRIGVTAARAQALRKADGSVGWLQLAKAPPRADASAKDATSVASAGSDAKPAAPWSVRLGEFDLQRGELAGEDQAMQPTVRQQWHAVALNVKNIVADGSEPARLGLRLRTGKAGTIAVDGDVRWDAPAARLDIDARALDTAGLRPYLQDRLNAILASMELSTRGRADLRLPKGAAPRVSYVGNARLANFRALNADGASDLLRWQALDVDRVDVQLADGPPRIELGQVKLADFYALAIISEQGRLNLADLIKQDAQTPVAPGAGVRPKTDPKKAPPAAASAPPPPPASSAGPRPVIRIGGVVLERGNINFTDNFIKPNYTTNLTGIGGTVSALASDNPAPANVQLAGKIDDDAPVEIKGAVNPLSPQLSLDIAASTKGVDMPRFAPYTARYAGYPITKGKLSMDVHYKVEDQKLTATNHLFIDQLTFGEKVDSPDATKLPVLLAVSLLKNTRGEIDLNLPISGSLDDPKFSLVGIIFQVIGNLIAKAITAPFSLLAAAFGGGEELGYVEFAPGGADLAPEQVKRIDTLAKALNDRPAVRVDIVGRVDPAVDTEGVRKAKYETKLRAAKVRRMVRGGGESIDPTKVTIDPAERPALIEAVYDEEKIPDKPRNFIGMAKSIPAPEMEALILKNLQAAPEDLRALANQRAAAVRNQLENVGKVPRERLFLVEPKLTADDIKDKGAKTRVDFVLK